LDFEIEITNTLENYLDSDIIWVIDVSKAVKEESNPVGS
jgi:hypothetical protein